MPEKILIVDDDVETLRLVGLMLQRQGYEVIAASSGQQSLQMAETESPDLIVLDIMMPDMDGYQVTGALRKQADTSLIPILMFTAKGQVDDKVAGYDAGADDYLTKPVHPAELIAHIKALLSRTRTHPVLELPVEKATLIGVVGSRGGIGVSTLTLNLATSFAISNKNKNVLAVEMRPGQGTWAYELGYNNSDGLNTVLQHKPNEINTALINSQLVETSFGIKLLLAPTKVNQVDFSALSDKLLALTRAISAINAVVFLDIGTNFMPGFEQICQHLFGIILLTDPQLVTVKRTKALIRQLEEANCTGGKALDLVLYNHVRADIQMNSVQVSEELNGLPVSVMIPPAPELATQAIQRHLPIVIFQSDGLVSQQFARLADMIHERMEKS